jgi:hypothetical protein
MIDSRLTLSKLHSKFPNLTLDDLFEILDCYTEVVTYDLKWPTYRDKSTTTWPYNTTIYGNPTATTTTNGTEITTSNPVR